MAVGRSSALEQFIGADGREPRLPGNPFPGSATLRSKNVVGSLEPTPFAVPR